MKILALVDSNKFIAEVNVTEIAKFLNLYYNKPGMPSITAGSEIDLAKGYDFHSDTVCALEKTQEFIKGNKAVIDAIISGIVILGKNDKTEDDHAGN